MASKLDFIHFSVMRTDKVALMLLQSISVKLVKPSVFVLRFLMVSVVTAMCTGCASVNLKIDETAVPVTVKANDVSFARYMSPQLTILGVNAQTGVQTVGHQLFEILDDPLSTYPIATCTLPEVDPITAVSVNDSELYLTYHDRLLRCSLGDDGWMLLQTRFALPPGSPLFVSKLNDDPDSLFIIRGDRSKLFFDRCEPRTDSCTFTELFDRPAAEGYTLDAVATTQDWLFVSGQTTNPAAPITLLAHLGGRPFDGRASGGTVTTIANATTVLQKKLNQHRVRHIQTATGAAGYLWLGGDFGLLRLNPKTQDLKTLELPGEHTVVTATAVHGKVLYVASQEVKSRASGKKPVAESTTLSAYTLPSGELISSEEFPELGKIAALSAGQTNALVFFQPEGKNYVKVYRLNF